MNIICTHSGSQSATYCAHFLLSHNLPQGSIWKRTIVLIHLAHLILQDEKESGSQVAAESGSNRSGQDVSSPVTSGIELGPIGLTFGGETSGSSNGCALLLDSRF